MPVHELAAHPAIHKDKIRLAIVINFLSVHVRPLRVSAVGTIPTACHYAELTRNATTGPGLAALIAAARSG